MLIFASLGGDKTVFATGDAYDEVRLRWKERMTGGTSYNPTDPHIAARIDEMDQAANEYWSTMNADHVWDDLLATKPNHLTNTYSRLRSMALAWSTHGSSLQNNAALKADIIAGLNWMYANEYNENSVLYGNWWHWEIGAPLYLNDTIILMYDELTQTQISNFMKPVAKFNSDPTKNYFNGATTFGSNRIHKAFIVALRGVIVKDGARITAGNNALSPMLEYVASDEGFYEDGSYLQHARHPYNGGYGINNISKMAEIFYLYDGSIWEVDDPNREHVFEWVCKAYEPFIYKGTMLEEVRGREISRQGTDNHVIGHHVIQSVIELSQMNTVQADAFKSMVKYWLQEDTYANFYSGRDIYMITKARDILSDGTLTPRGGLLTHRQFPNMDRIVHRRPGFLFSISMSSDRIFNYESINNENLKGWYTGDGATYLYTGALDEYSDNYWPTVDPYRLPGTTVDTQVRGNGSGHRYLSPRTWVGGTSISGLYGVAGMAYDAWNSTLTANKAWFMFDDEIVALGSGINSTDGRTIETIVENRKLNAAGDNVLTVNGVQKSSSLGWEETMSGIGWIHLEGTGGYVFPDPTTVKGKRESRIGAWRDINLGQSANPYTRNYLTLWKDHGSNPADDHYAYVILPNKTASEVQAYAAASDITVVENSENVMAVRENTQHIVAAAFWKDLVQTADIITSNRASAVMVKETPGADLEVSISDPTRQNTGHIYVEIAKSAESVLSKEVTVTVTQLSPTIKLIVNVNGSKGASHHIKFNMPGLNDYTPPSSVTDLSVERMSDDSGFVVGAGRQLCTNGHINIRQSFYDQRARFL